MLPFLLWYLIITALGLLTFPLAYHLLPGLPDRGYAFSRAMGWLLWGFIFWLLGSFGLIGNDLGGEWVSFLILLALSGWALRRSGWESVKTWLRSHRGMILTVEILFLLAFAAWAAVRATHPDIIGTEKPMELAFINAILRSPRIPPHDPWLSGFAISYYYFGYLLVAMIAQIAATTGGVAFNLGVALIFGLSASGAYGILYNLLASRPSYPAPRTPHPAPRTPHPATRTSLLAPFFLLIVSNLGGLLHLLRLGGLFWQTDETGQLVSPVWAWLDLGRFSQPPPTQAFPHWWWWQASRIVQDFDFNMINKGDVIDEFPFFSYLLGDLHPHVLAMPFALLAVGLALNLLLGGAKGKFPWPRLRIRPAMLALSAVVFGGMAFLNTWDFPFYVALFAGAYALRSPAEERDEDRLQRFTGDVFKDFFLMGVTLGIAGILFYLPFFVGFSSQAGGLLPNLIYVTRGIYLWLMFAPLLVPLFAFLVASWRADADLAALKRGMLRALVIVAVLLLLSLLIAAFISVVHVFSGINPEAATAANVFLTSQGAPHWRALLIESFARRLTVPGTLLTLVALLGLTIAVLWPRAFPHPPRKPSTSPQATDRLSPASLFVHLLILLGALLILAPEFMYLRDLFGYRINTIFKFYYVAWLLWSLAAAYATATLWSRLRPPWRSIFRLSLVVVLALGLIYPLLGLWTRTDGFQPSRWRLDGTAYLQTNTPDEYAAMQWLWQAPLGVVAEAVGGSYTGFARMAAHSGQPTVLGWEFHEMQWRGDAEKLGSRRGDIERLYCTPTWSEARQILEQYQIRYVVVGNRERTAYATGSAACPAGLRETKFASHMSVAFQQGNVTLYEVSLTE